MDAHGKSVSLGLPRIRNEPGEVRDFLPSLAQAAAEAGAEVCVESGYGRGLGFRDSDYESVSRAVRIVDRNHAYSRDIVLLLRPARDSFDLLQPGTTLVAMLHFPTHKARAKRFKELGIDALALDLVRGDDGERLVEDMTAVAWSGIEIGFDLLMKLQLDFAETHRPPSRVTVIGAGMVGKHAVEAATKFGNLRLAELLLDKGIPGVEVTSIGRNLSCNASYMRWRLQQTDILVDATRRSDPSRALVPKSWLAELPPHAVIVDLAVDQYLLEDDPPVVRGIEGTPAGDLRQYVFSPEDPAWQALPNGVPIENRRWVVSCYGWPGLKPLESVTHYGQQIEPLLIELIRRGGARFLRPDGNREERALYRGSLANWINRL